jgi:hypothetical protein
VPLQIGTRAVGRPLKIQQRSIRAAASGPNRVLEGLVAQQTRQSGVGAASRIEDHRSIQAMRTQNRAVKSERMNRQFQGHLAAGGLAPVNTKTCATDRKVKDLSRARLGAWASHMQQRSANIGCVQYWPIRLAVGLDRFGLGVQIKCNFQEHSRKSQIIS